MEVTTMTQMQLLNLLIIISCAFICHYFADVDFRNFGIFTFAMAIVWSCGGLLRLELTYLPLLLTAVMTAMTTIYYIVIFIKRKLH